MFLYVLCCIACAATILIAGLLYRKFGHKAFKYLSLLMVGGMLLMLVEAVRTYSSIASADMETFRCIVYLTPNPIGEIIQFLMFPAVAFAAVGKRFPRKLSIISKIYALAIVATLPSREKEITELMLKGYSNKQIGKTLFISVKTVKNHIYSIYRKTQVQNRIQLANRIKLHRSIIKN